MLFCCAVIAGLDDNIRYIVEVEHDFEGLLAPWFVFLTGALIYLLAGYLTDKMKYLKGIIFTCLIAICAIFSLLLVVDTEIMKITYVFSSAIPIYILWVVCIALPVRYAKQQPGFAGFGYAILYFGMILTSILFLFLPEDSYITAIALVLIFAVASLALIYFLYSIYDKQRYSMQLNIIKEEYNSGTTIDYAAITSNFGLTPRENELFPFIISPLTANEIAKTENISVATVKYHIGNVLSKTSCENRRALRILIEDGSLNSNKNEYSTNK